MGILSKRMMGEVAREYGRVYDRRAHFIDLEGRALRGNGDVVACLSNSRRRRNYALQECINTGDPYVYEPAPGLATCVVGLEDRRMVHGGIVGGEVRLEGSGIAEDVTLRYLAKHGFPASDAARHLSGLPVWTEARVKEGAAFLQETFYNVSGWKPELMKENQRRLHQQQQLNQAIEDQKRRGEPALYAFEKERVLLANIRAGDRNGARRLLNEMLAVIYMSSPKLVVLRARAVELMSCLTRAAIEDNPLMEPLIERNHRWTEQLITAPSFEVLSEVLTTALDEFIDGIYLHGANRSSKRVRMALDFISLHYSRKISLQEVADEVELSTCRLSHLVKERTGRTVVQIIQQVRIRHAQQLLERTTKSCADIAYDVGFGDQSYFIKHFKKLTGTTPARYRRSGRS